MKPAQLPVYLSCDGEYGPRCGKVRNDNSGIARDAMLFSIPEYSQVRCCSRFRNWQTENSGILRGAVLFSIPELSKRRIPKLCWFKMAKRKPQRGGRG